VSKANIHPTAIVEDGARIADGVTIGAYAYIGGRVELGTGTIVHHHATVEGNTRMGERNEVFPYAFIGGRTQDKKFKGGNPGILIGDDNIFREFTTVHPATFEGDFTRIGSRNLFCAYAHIGHECTVGNGVVFSNNATLAGHVVIGDHVVIGGLTAVHQFCRIGEGAMLAGCSKVVQDVFPHMIADGHPVEHRGVNKVGMERHGFSHSDIMLMRRVFKLFFRSGLNHSQAIEKIRAGEAGTGPLVDAFCAFHEASSRGIA